MRLLLPVLSLALLSTGCERSAAGPEDPAANPGAEEGGQDGDPGDDQDDDQDDTDDQTGDEGDEGGDIDDPEEDDDPSEYTYEEDEINPLLDAEAVEQAMGEAMATFFDLDPWLAFEAMDQTWAMGDAGCPYEYDYYLETYGYHYLYGGCTSDSGVTYDGYVYGIHTGPYDSGYYHYNDYGWWSGDWSASLADGQVYDQSGYFYGYDYTYTYYGYQVTYTQFLGEAIWTGDQQADTWLADPYSQDWTVTSTGYPDYGNQLTINGGLGGLKGTATTIHFDGLYAGSGAYASSCELEPGGIISIRDSEGEWYQVAFDGPTYDGAEVFPPTCDGCGELWFRGEKFGQVCPDFSTLFDWELTPW